MSSSIFKFYNIGTAKFVAEELRRMGHQTKLLSSGFISVEGVIGQDAANFIVEQRGAVVVSGPTVTPAVSKILGAGSVVDKRKLPPPTEEPKSPPTATRKGLIKPGKASADQRASVGEEAEAPKKDSKVSPEVLKGLAFEALNKMVERNPNRFPKLAKMFGIEVKK